jgi:hypothetical protein
MKVITLVNFDRIEPNSSTQSEAAGTIAPTVVSECPPERVEKGPVARYLETEFVPLEQHFHEPLRTPSDFLR